MKTQERPDHHALAAALRDRVLGGPGATSAELRQAVARRAEGGPPITPPYDDLAREIGEATHRVTDAQMQRVLADAHTQPAAFEIVIAAAVAAGLRRWQRGIEAVQEAADAAA